MFIKKISKLTFLIIFLFMPFLLRADKYVLQDTIRKNQLLIKPEKLILPASMLAVGAVALKSHVLQDINHGVRHMVLQTRPNVNRTYEDQLRYVPVAATFLLPALGHKGKHNMLDKVMLFTISTTILDQAVGRLKTAGKFKRPDGDDNRSFPSGHTTTAFAAAEFMRQEYKDTSPWLVAGAYTAAAATGFLRVYHNKHWLTDVVAGAGLGILSTDVAYYIYPKVKRMMQKKQKDQDQISITPAYVNNTLGFSAVIQLN